MATMPISNALRQIERLFAKGTVAGLSDAALLKRYITARDDDAFAALVERHGAMVRAVCRSVLRDADGAEDAFQATFLILIRQAGSLWVDESLGGWLHRVAHRTAVRARADAERRRKRERAEPVMDIFTPRRQESAHDTTALLHEEIARLPDAYRKAVVLCYLEGRTHVEAAHALRCGEATIRRRLASARARLRHRLERRGLVPALALPDALPTLEPLPPRWTEGIVNAVSGQASPAVVSLVHAVGRAITHQRIVRALSVVLTVALAAGGLGLAWLKVDRAGTRASKRDAPPQVVAAPEPPPARSDDELKPAQAPSTPQPQPVNEDEVVARGRVLGPDGKALQGASIFVRDGVQKPPANRGTSDASGTFRFVTERSRPWAPTDMRPSLVATAPGFGLSLPVPVPSDNQGPPLTLALVDDVPIEGRVIDRAGRPVASARIRIRQLYWPRAGDLSSWLAAMQRASDVEEVIRTNHKHLQSIDNTTLLGDISGAHAPLVPPTVTDRDGRFRLAGIGRERVVELIVEGPEIASSLSLAVTRPIDAFTVPAEMAKMRAMISNAFDDLRVVGSRFDLVADAGRTLEGHVRDRVSGQPVAGLKMIGGWRSLLEHPGYDRFVATTDDGGAFRIEGLPAGGRTDLTVEPPDDRPYFGARKAVSIPTGSGPFTVDLRVRQGVWVKGTVLDAASGTPVEDAALGYFVFTDNPGLSEDRTDGLPPEFSRNRRSGPDGTFAILAYPGRGLVTATRYGYLTGLGMAAITGLEPDRDVRALLYPPGQFSADNFSTVTEVAPTAGEESETIRLVLRKGASRTVQVVGPDGAPLANIEACGLSQAIENPMKAIASDQFTVENLAPGETRLVVARQAAMKLSGVVRVKADGDSPVTLTLRPAASVTGRVVDDQGQPRSRGLEIQLDEGKLPLHTVGGRNYFHPRFTIEPDGRFRVDGLIADEPYGLNLLEGGVLILGPVIAEPLNLAPGEARDLGDVKLLPPVPRDAPPDRPKR